MAVFAIRWIDFVKQLFCSYPFFIKLKFYHNYQQLSIIFYNYLESIWLEKVSPFFSAQPKKLFISVLTFF